MQALLERWPGLRAIPRAELGLRPTPVEEHLLDGLRVMVKREDLCSERCGGNKARALEFALARPGRRVLTFSTLSANHAYATAVHAGVLGKQTVAILVRRGRRGATLQALHGVTAGIAEVDGNFAAAVAALRLWERGTLVVPPGAMGAAGALGSLAALFEIDDAQVPPRIYVPLGTGTTASGLLAGLMLRGAVCEVVAVRVADRIAGWAPLVWWRARRALRLLRRYDRTVPRVGRGAVRLRVVAAAGGYGEPTAESEHARSLAPGLPIDGTYAAKALAVLLAERSEGAMFWLTSHQGRP